MGLYSKTGLLPTNKTISITYKVKPTIHLKATSIPAPYTLKPFAGLYNPYQSGCSLLCNHPADNQTKELLRKAKDAWATEGKPLLMVEEVAAIKKTLEELKSSSYNERPINVFDVDNMEEVPEELFRRYTETDSRPLTPTPTIISNYTRTSAATRRCVTPDPTFTMEIKEKTQLILDLRRSHSQETLSYFGCGSNVTTTEQSSIKIQQISLIQSPKSSLLTVKDERTIKQMVKPKERVNRVKSEKPKIIVENIRPKSSLINVKHDIVPPKIVLDEDKLGDEDRTEDDLSIMKRRGKKRQKKRDSSRGPFPVQTSIDPETQIATIGINSHNPSARPSLVSNTEIDELTAPKKLEIRKTSLDVGSYLDVNILKQLRRELNEEVIENEFNHKRKEALEEALKTLRKNKVVCSELKSLQKELKLPKLNVDFWLSLPRKFSRSSTRFELPADSRSFSKMTPIDYLKNHVVITSSRKLLYNHVFNRNKTEFDLDVGQPRELLGKNMRKSLDEMMGTPLNDQQYEKFYGLVGWKDEEVFDFKTFCGICALCERLLGPEFCFLNKKEDPCQEIEIVDFGSLEKRLKGQNVDERLSKIMYGIKNL